jgi:hypothetical protein
MAHPLGAIKAELETIARSCDVAIPGSSESLDDFANRIIQHPAFPQSYLRDVLDLKARAHAALLKTRANPESAPCTTASI